MISQSFMIRACLMLIICLVLWIYIESMTSIPTTTKKEYIFLPINYTTAQPLMIQSQRKLSEYINVVNNTILIQPNSPCNGNMFFVVIICSAVKHFKSREAIRKTWGLYGTSQNNTTIYFFLGNMNDSNLNDAVAIESSKYSDIIQDDFLDTYNNLTLKSVLMLKWVSQNCGHANYVMKTDDDMFIHIPNLLRVLQAKGHSELMLGCLIKGAVPVKNQSSKWYVSDEMFSGQKYPPYLSGTGYVLSGEVVKKLYRTALDMKFFYLEDVFITGMCASKIGLQPVNDNGFHYRKRASDYCTFKSLITAHRMTPKELLVQWRKLHVFPPMECNVTDSLSVTVH